MALVLSRSIGEGVWIGDDTHVSIGWVDGNKVRLAITAPRDIVILRDELTDKPRPSLARPKELPEPPA